jgi:hypothetical protein
LPHPSCMSWRAGDLRFLSIVGDRWCLSDPGAPRIQHGRLGSRPAIPICPFQRVRERLRVAAATGSSTAEATARITIIGGVENAGPVDHH